MKNLTTPRQMQELLTILRTVGGLMKIFDYSPSHALAFRAGDVDLSRAEWLIRQLDKPANQPAGNQTFVSPQGDDMTRVFFLSNATPEGVPAAVKNIRAELNRKKIFWMNQPSAIIVRGTTDQIGAVTQWMAAHNTLAD